ncbi:hypothetical protein [Streptomyces sp. NRRL S-350]|uniref:hypothetical protein n=1 Tax=Streptomyces sp. NRRL S-350 TaxID=1463902 RepID=UPI00131DBE74|nr:hypothetical protein [Streptomyces sp. NRRL S-350]
MVEVEEEGVVGGPNSTSRPGSLSTWSITRRVGMWPEVWRRRRSYSWMQAGA